MQLIEFTINKLNLRVFDHFYYIRLLVTMIRIYMEDR